MCALLQVCPLAAQVLMQTSVFKTFLGRIMGSVGDSVVKSKAKLAEYGEGFKNAKAGDVLTG